MLDILNNIFPGFQAMDWRMLVMYAIGVVLICLAILKDYEPMLLLPIGFGAILVNLPQSTVWLHEGVDGFLKILYDVGIENEMFPILMFIGVGAMIDFSQLLRNPRMFFFGAAAQFGIFSTIIIALLVGGWLKNMGFDMGIDLKVAATIGIIGAADGPTSIVVAAKFARQYLGPVTVAAYSYMALVPIIQPPVIRALTTKKERQIRMSDRSVPVSRGALIAFPIMIALVAGILAPMSASLIGALMFGNLLRACGVLERLSKAAQNELSNLVTLLMGITIGATMRYDEFLTPQTIIIMSLGLVAFIFDTAGGVLFAKWLNLFTKEKINPMVGAAGISAFPMSSRIVQKMAAKEDPTNFILMQAASANVAGQLGSVIAGSVILQLVPALLSR